jgi:hypothetical protein
METLTKFSLSRNSDFGVWRFSTLRGSVLPKFFFSLNGAQETHWPDKLAYIVCGLQRHCHLKVIHGLYMAIQKLYMGLD